MNKLIMIGVIKNVPKLTNTKNGNELIVVDLDTGEGALLEVLIMGETAKVNNGKLSQGDMVYMEGRLRNKKDNTYKNNLVIYANYVLLVQSKYSDKQTGDYGVDDIFLD